MEAVLEDRPYADIVSKKINQKFEALLDKLKRTNDIAALNGIPSESNALLENCLADIKNEESAYQRAKVQQQPSGDKTKEQPDVTPVKVIHTEPITMRTLTRGKSYSIKDSNDVEAFLQEIRRELMAKLGDALLAGIQILLENYQLATIYLEQLDELDRKEFENYPIYNLMKQET